MPFRNLILCSSLLAACSIAAQAQAVSKSVTINQSYAFPPVGVASNESLQVNLANAFTVPANAVTATAPSCTGTVTITNASGAVIGKANPFTVGAGAIQSITVPYGSLGVSGGARAEVLVTVERSITVPAPVPAVPCSLIYSLETFLTTTGETHLILGNTSTNGVVPVLSAVLSPVPPTGNGGNGGNGGH